MTTSILKTLLVPVFIVAMTLPAFSGDKSYESSLVCANCHEDNYRNWKGSLHALSYSNPIFQTAYRKAYTETKGSAKKYCLNCHAPTVSITGDYDVELPITTEGVTCDFCHTVAKIDLDKKDGPFHSEPGETKRSVLENAESPHHKTAYSKDFAGSKLCAGCHSFENRHGVKVGDTYNEWLRSPYANEGKECQNCHMKEIDGKTAIERGREKIHDHSLSHNLSTMTDSVTVKITHVEKTAKRIGVSLDITNEKIGHSVPTGTPARKLVLEVRTHNAKGAVIETLSKEYRKIVVNADGDEIQSDGDVFLYGVKITEDNRLKPKETRSEKFILSRKTGSVASVSAELFFQYEPVVTERTLMKIPLFSSQSIVK